MPLFAHFFHMAPSEYWRLTVPEFNALVKYYEDYAREMERANRG